MHLIEQSEAAFEEKLRYSQAVGFYTVFFFKHMRINASNDDEVCMHVCIHTVMYACMYAWNYDWQVARPIAKQYEETKIAKCYIYLN